jgi:hypothetical protein
VLVIPRASPWLCKVLLVCRRLRQLVSAQYCTALSLERRRWQDRKSGGQITLPCNIVMGSSRPRPGLAERAMSTRSPYRKLMGGCNIVRFDGCLPLFDKNAGDDMEATRLCSPALRLRMSCSRFSCSRRMSWATIFSSFSRHTFCRHESENKNQLSRIDIHNIVFISIIKSNEYYQCFIHTILVKTPQ